MRFLPIIIAMLHAGLAVGTPLLPPMPARGEVVPTGSLSDAQAGAVDVNLNNPPPGVLRLEPDTIYTYECMPMENGPWSDCRGIDWWFNNMTEKHGGHFWINLFADRCWTLQAGVCRLYVCQNGAVSGGLSLQVDGKEVQGMFNDWFQKECNKGTYNLAGHAWSDDFKVHIYSGIAS